MNKSLQNHWIAT